MKLTPAIKGGITGALMIIVSVLVFNAGLPGDSVIHYLVFAIFGAGIIWALIAYKKLTPIRASLATCLTRDSEPLSSPS
ncbi:MAG: hypothetical protein IPM85_07720 [Chitinophagaceae bacterium]|nr:hypothetical protein [Chitinophagaceae bacterium]